MDWLFKLMIRGLASCLVKLITGLTSCPVRWLESMERKSEKLIKAGEPLFWWSDVGVEGQDFYGYFIYLLRISISLQSKTTNHWLKKREFKYQKIFDIIRRWLFWSAFDLSQKECWRGWPPGHFFFTFWSMHQLASVEGWTLYWFHAFWKRTGLS